MMLGAMRITCEHGIWGGDDEMVDVDCAVSTVMYSTSVL